MAGQLGVRMRVWDLAPPRPRAAGGVCVGSRQSGSDTSVGRVCLWGCAAQGAPCKRAGSWGCKEEGARSGSTQPLQGARRAPYAAMLPSRGFARHEQQGWGQTLGCPPHSTAQSAACSLRGEGAEATGPGCEGRMTDGQRGRGSPAALHLRRGSVSLGRGGMPVSA
eukprot:CAMPEP_0174694150 /NCGR_PEP_ID=MMETSP1094-20130205/792_1 /TAXON_ID=156173 /ORGANISM="Chrysochromulina brevifilum, Strain UTEX LB 985" /LENGTH=165 /DNA_ID=CAMNT_0015890301 /DNA_START=214 /DNA_END=708 /DNA_ORIENTATION=-